MSAETLRRAAALMRERAEVASSAPWSVAAVGGMGFAVHRGEHDTISLYSQRQDAEHIASWHPGVALAVAEWLERTLDRHEPVTPPDDEPICGYCVHRAPVFMWPCVEAEDALAVARTYLGESA